MTYTFVLLLGWICERSSECFDCLGRRLVSLDCEYNPCKAASVATPRGRWFRGEPFRAAIPRNYRMNYMSILAFARILTKFYNTVNMSSYQMMGPAIIRNIPKADIYSTINYHKSMLIAWGPGSSKPMLSRTKTGASITLNPLIMSSTPDLH
jgi:hypothetical protein